ncbi:unnamed protein product, partial [Brenthis ino]
MDYSILLVALLVALVEIQAKELKEGPEAVSESSNSSSSTPAQKTQKRYVTKEIILYLTPSQIEALKSGKGLVSPKSVPQLTEQQHPKKQLTFEEHEDLIRQQFENIKVARIASNEKRKPENVLSESPIYEKSQEEEQVFNRNHQKNLDYVNIWSQNQPKIREQQNFQYVYPKFKDTKVREELNNQEKTERPIISWLPYSSVSDKKALEEQWKPVLDQNRIQLKALASLSPKENSEIQFSQIQTEKPLLQLQYAPRYNDQKHAIEIEKIIRQRHRSELEKQSALAQAEAIANSPPILVHHEVKITKHNPVPVVKQIKVEVPTPVLVPIPEPYEVKVPHPYPVPFEIIKHIPVPVIQREKTDVEKPFEVERLLPLQITKEVLVNANRPYFFHKIPVELNKDVSLEIPGRKADKVSILQYGWNQ